MNKTLRKSLFFILKICVTLLVISPFYIAIIYSVKSKPEMVTNRLAFPKGAVSGDAGAWICTGAGDTALCERSA